MTTALAFGVFDNLHEGHKDFLSQALKRCDELIVVVARPEIVQILKNRLPKQTIEERAEAVRSFDPRIKAVAGDSTLGSWEVLRSNHPDIIFLGYDQKGIADELKKQNIKFEFLSAHQPEKYKSSILNKES